MTAEAAGLGLQKSRPLAGPGGGQSVTELSGCATS